MDFFDAVRAVSVVSALEAAIPMLLVLGGAMGGSAATIITQTIFRHRRERTPTTIIVGREA